MYITQAFNVLHDWWRYLFGTLIAIIGVFIFSMPHGFAILAKRMNAEVDMSRFDDVNYLMSLFEPNLNLVFMLLPFAGGLLFLIIAVKLLHKQSFTQLTTVRSKIDWKRFWFAFILWGVASSGLIFLDYSMDPESYQWNFNMQPFLILCVLAIILVPLQTSFEEYLFRGYLMQGIGVSTTNNRFPFAFLYILASIVLYVVLERYAVLGYWTNMLLIFGLTVLLVVLLSTTMLDKIYESELNQKLMKVLRRNVTPLIITSAAFGLLHIANPEIDQLGHILLVYYIGTGLFLGIMTLMDDGLELALGFHAANNLFTALLVTADWTAFQTHSIYKDISQPEAAGFIDVFMPVLVIFPLVLLIFSKKYKWSNWNDKLFGSIKTPPKEDYQIIGETIDD